MFTNILLYLSLICLIFKSKFRLFLHTKKKKMSKFRLELGLFTKQANKNKHFSSLNSSYL